MIDFSELEKFESRLADSSKRVDRVGTKITVNSAGRMVGSAKRSVHRKTGRLKSSIRIMNKGSFGKDKVGAEFGTDVPYAVFEQAHHPFLRPAADRYHDQWVDRIGQAAVRLIAKGS